MTFSVSFQESIVDLTPGFFLCRVLGEHERISVYDALYAVTLDAAYTLKMDHDVGSIEPGKLADFTVLEEDPFAVDPMKLNEIKIRGTVLGGKLFPATRR